MAIPISLVAARARNGVIGRDGGLPWRLKSDLAWFKSVTVGKPVIMGRRTWDSLPFKPLPGRMNIVLTRDGSFESRHALAFENFNEAVATAREQAEEDGVSEICVIGGAALYALALPKARRIYMTEVQAEPEGDTLFPDFDESAWREVSVEPRTAGEGDDHDFVLRVLERP
ncbi:MAG: dihydrofolate reductase [Caulobacter sp.]|nr:dihydrofolate reductase [Caulobacter sp.]